MNKNLSQNQSKLFLPEPPLGRQGWPWDVESMSPHTELRNGSTWPKVTVVTPSLNQGDFLEEAIRSILLQGYPNLEYIIIDGGSTDQSLQIIRKYEPWLTFWTSKKDEGQSAAINEGFRLAQGEYLTWLNSDDVFLPGAIDYAVEKLHYTPQAGMVYGKVDVIDEGGLPIGSFGSVTYKFEDLLTLKIILPQQGAFFRKTVLDSMGFLREDLHYAMDVEFFIRIGSKYDIFSLNQTIALFRLTTTSKGITAKVNWCPEFIKIIDGFFHNPDLPSKYLAIKTKAFGGAYYRGAHTYLEQDQYSLARDWLIYAARFYRKYWMKLGWWKGFIMTLLGNPGKQALQSILIWLHVNRIYVNEMNWQIGITARDLTYKNKSRIGS